MPNADGSPTVIVPGSAMVSVTSLRSHWDGEWDEWDGARFREQVSSLARDQMFPVVSRYVDKGTRVLEAGCGTGRWVRFLDQVGYRVCGIDYSSIGVERSKQYSSDAQVALADIAALPFGDETFDAYLSFGVLEHFRVGPQLPLREAARVLRDGGILIATLPCSNLYRRMPLYRAKNWIKSVPALRGLCGKRGRGTFFEYHFAPSSVKTMFRSLGCFEVVEVRAAYHGEGLAYDCHFFSTQSGGITVPNRLGTRLAKWLCRFSPWVTNHMVAVVARKIPKAMPNERFYFHPSYAVWN